jgi:putative Mg2+ transporter-C (MgtC) family protein
MTLGGESDFAARILLGLFAGGAIGLEREFRQKMAGVRTNALVAVGAAGVGASAWLIGTPQDSHIAAQVVTGVGFLGGGVILREGFSVHGLNTAATLWCAAMVGSLAGIGHPVATLIATAAVVGANLLLRPIVHRLDARLAAQGRATGRYAISLICTQAAGTRLRPMLIAAVRNAGLLVDGVQSGLEPGDGVLRLTIRADGFGRDAAIEAALAALTGEPGVQGSSWTEERMAPDS